MALYAENTNCCGVQVLLSSSAHAVSPFRLIAPKSEVFVTFVFLECDTFCLVVIVVIDLLPTSLACLQLWVQF
jgi:hypothetical protein